MRIRTSLLLTPCILSYGCTPMAVYPDVQHAPSRPRTEPVLVARDKPDAPKLKRLSNGHYRVRKPWTVDLNGRRWRVQPGYTSNGITAPANMKHTLGDGVEHPETWAAVFHDWLFTQPGISRAQADKLFYDLLLEYGIPTQKAKMMYTTVAAYSFSKSFR